MEALLWVIFSATVLKTLLVTDAVWDATGRHGVITRAAAWAKSKGRTVQERHANPIDDEPFNKKRTSSPLAQVGRGSGMPRRKTLPRYDQDHDGTTVPRASMYYYVFVVIMTVASRRWLLVERAEAYTYVKNEVQDGYVHHESTEYDDVRSFSARPSC